MLLERPFLFSYNPGMTRTARIGILLLALAPLAYLPGGFTHDDIPKRIVISIAACLLMIAWGAPARRGRSLSLRQDRLVVPLVLAWAASFASFLACVLRGGNPYEAFWPLYLQAGGLIVYLAASTLPGDDRFVREVLPRWMVGGACVVAAYGLLQRAGIDPFNPPWANPDREAGSTLGGTTYAGEYLALVFPLALALVFRAAAPAGRAVASLSVLLIAAHLLMTGARGAWLGASAGSVLFLVLGLVKRAGAEGERAIPSRAAGRVAGVIVAMVAILQVSGAVDWIGRLREAVAPAAGRDTGLVRRELWGSTVRMAADHPVLGVGPGQYELNIQPYRTRAEMLESDPKRLGRAAGMAHNDFLHRLAETGALGGAVVVLVLYALIRKSVAHLRGAADPETYLMVAGLLAGVSAAAVSGLVGNALHQPVVGALVLLFLGLSERLGNRTPGGWPIRTTGTWRGLSWGGLMLMLAGLAAGFAGTLLDVLHARFLECRKAAAHHDIVGADREAMQGLRSSVEKGVSALAWVGDRWDIRRTLGLSYLESSSRADWVSAAFHLARARDLNPHDAETWNAWGRLCWLQGNGREARDAFERAVRLDPIVRKPRLNLALACDRDGMLDKALAQYEALVEVDSRDAEAHLWRGLTLVRLGRHAEAAMAFTAAQQAERYAEPVRRFGLRETLLRDGTPWAAFRASEPGKAWLDGTRE